MHAQSCQTRASVFRTDLVHADNMKSWEKDDLCLAN
jgi:hypothetical protein